MRSAAISGAEFAWDQSLGVRFFEEGESLYRENESCPFIFILKAGAVKITRQIANLRGRMGHSEFIVNVAGPGDLIGARAVLLGASQPESAKVLRRAEVEVFPVQTIERVIKGPPTLLQSLLISLGQSLEMRDREAARNYLASVSERIALCLLQLSDRFGTATDGGIRLGLRLSRNELAQLSGTINESLSRHLTEMKAEGILELRGKEIFVRNRAALMAKAGIIG